MATVRDIMTKEVATVDPETTLRDTLELLRAEDVTGAPVVTNGDVIGVVSLTDLMEFEATSPAVPTERSTQPEWGEFEEPNVWEAGDESPAAYFVDFWDDVGADVAERFESPEAPEWDLLEEHVVGEVMSRQVIAMSPDDDLRDAAKLMLEAVVHRVLVMEDSELLGIVTATDIVRAVAEGTL